VTLMGLKIRSLLDIINKCGYHDGHIHGRMEWNE
jgi:hypothetical protein